MANDSTQNCVQCIKPSKYKDASGKYNKKYLLNKDGFVFLAFGFGKEADAWKWKYIDAFNRMERLVYEKNTAAYQIADQEERATRRAETDVIKEFVEYARAQGSTHADHYYSNYTRLAYKSVGITDKTTAAGSQLDDLALVEHLITHTLRTGMAAGSTGSYAVFTVYSMKCFICSEYRHKTRRKWMETVRGYICIG